jgi:hypothetical protein
MEKSVCLGDQPFGVWQQKTIPSFKSSQGHHRLPDMAYDGSELQVLMGDAVRDRWNGQ